VRNWPPTRREGDMLPTINQTKPARERCQPSPKARRSSTVRRAGLVRAAAGLFVLLSFVACTAQETPPVPSVPAPSGAVFSRQQLDQMLAPIALYPDSLLAQILTAATYPLEVVEANRWLQVPANASLKGDQLVTALTDQPWDPSIKSLVPFPRILKMMDDNLEWTEKVGDAFLAQHADVMDSVQRLRQAARASGSLAPNAYQTVTSEDGFIVIQPVSPAMVYWPCYSPAVAFGVWPWPGYQPYYWACTGPWLGFPVIYPLWGWWHWHWHHHRLYIDVARYNAINVHHPPIKSDVWEHDPSHRDGVPYRDAATRARFQGAVTPEARAAARGYPTGGAPHGVAPSPPVFESYGRGSEVRADEARGASSIGAPRGGGGGFGGGEGGFYGGGGGGGGRR
jgi:uncharacterized membrane protein YgcG